MFGVINLGGLMKISDCGFNEVLNIHMKGRIVKTEIIVNAP
jgi:hypothetical protein